MSLKRCAVVAAIQDKVDAIADLCLKCGVVQLHIFGSATRDDFRPGESDLGPRPVKWCMS